MRALLAAACLFFFSCPSIPGSQNALDRLKPFLPKVTFQRLNIKKVTFKQADVDFVFDVKNPNPLQVKLSTFGYQLDFESQKVLAGNNPNGLVLAASGSSEISLPVTTKEIKLAVVVVCVRLWFFLGCGWGVLRFVILYHLEIIRRHCWLFHPVNQ